MTHFILHILAAVNANSTRCLVKEGSCTKGVKNCYLHNLFSEELDAAQRRNCHSESDDWLMTDLQQLGSLHTHTPDHFQPKDQQQLGSTQLNSVQQCMHMWWCRGRRMELLLSRENRKSIEVKAIKRYSRVT